jgi:hypothetical protein
MFAGCDRAGFGPGEQFIGGDRALAHLQVLLRVVRHPLGQLLGMRQEKVDVESTRLIEHLFSGIQSRSFLAIGSPLPACAQVKEQLRRARCLSHLVALLVRTKVLKCPQCTPPVICCQALSIVASLGLIPMHFECGTN